MKRIVKNSLFTAILMVWGMMYSSCEGWTDPESINIHYPTFEEQNPQLYADYIRDLKRYKDGEHKLVFVSFDNPETNPISPDVPGPDPEGWRVRRMPGRSCLPEVRWGLRR